MSLWPSTIKILISNLPRTRKFSQLFKNTGGEHLLLSWSRVGHAPCPIFMLWLVKIWQVSSCGKFMQHLQHLETCLLWQLKLTEFFVNLWCFLLSFPTGCTKWNTAAINSLLLFMAGLFIEFLVEKCAACQSQKSDFVWHRFHFSPCWMRVEKSLKRLSGAASRMVSLSYYCVCFFISNFMKSSAVYEASLCTFVLRSEDNDLT